MSYLAHSFVVKSEMIKDRLTSCAAQEGILDPRTWVEKNLWILPTIDLLRAWAFAEKENPGADHGANEDLIPNELILACVVKVKSRFNPKPWVAPKNNQDAYPKWIHVVHQGTVWFSLLDSNVLEPGVAGWEVSE
jgi:hypothetical protein